VPQLGTAGAYYYHPVFRRPKTAVDAYFHGFAQTCNLDGKNRPFVLPKGVTETKTGWDRNKERASSVCLQDDIVYGLLRHRCAVVSSHHHPSKKRLLYITIRRTRRPSSSGRVVPICSRAVGIYHGYVSQQIQVAGAIWSQNEGKVETLSGVWAFPSSCEKISRSIGNCKHL
jgi:hypothetical protein